MDKLKNQNTNHWMWPALRAVFAITGISIICWSAQPALAADNLLLGQEWAIITQTNQIREQVGLPPLMQDGRLMISASRKALDMASQGYFDHGNPDGYRMAYWINGAGYTYSLAGENLAKGFSSLDRLMNAWVTSPSHYKNLVESKFTDIGVGMAEGWYENQQTLFIVQHFGAPAASTTQNIAELAAPLVSLITPLVESVAGTSEQQTAINTSPTPSRSASKALNSVSTPAPLTVPSQLIAAANAQSADAAPAIPTGSDSGAIQFWPIFALIGLALIGYLEEFFPLWSEESSLKVKK